jgi:hypothetical protein
MLYIVCAIRVLIIYNSVTLQCMQLMGAENRSDATGGISTQVLDLVLGVPVSRMAVKLWLECGNTWTQISEG